MSANAEPRPGHLERLLAEGHFAVTAEIVPPRSAASEPVTEAARSLVGYVDAVNVTDNPRASAHMAATAGVAFVAQAGIEPTLQLTLRDRNRLALTSELLGGWALGARNLLCLSGDPMKIGDHPDAAEVWDIDVLQLIELASGLRGDGRLLSGEQVADPPRYFVGAAEAPLIDTYNPARLEQKLDAGARFVQTQVVFDVERFAAWAEDMRGRGIFERCAVLPGVAPLRSAKGARFMNEKVPGIIVPQEMIVDLEEAGEADSAGAAALGVTQCVEIIQALRAIPGIRGVHVMGLGHEEPVLAVIEAAGLLPRPSWA